MKKIKLPTFLLLIVCCLSGCGPVKPSFQCNIKKITGMGNIVLDLTGSKSKEQNVVPGDSLILKFDNGLIFNDVPFYNGLYGEYHEIVVTFDLEAKNDDIQIVEFFGNFAKDFAVKPENKVTLSLNEKGKYNERMNNYRLPLSNNRNAYPSDEAFTNYRSLKMGNLKDNIIYRSVNPNDEAFNRKPIIMPLVERDKIATIMNMSETKEAFISKYPVLTPYYQNLYDSNNIVFGNAEFNVFSESYRNNLCNMFKTILNKPLPLLIHCLLGRDRTGFACAVLGMLADASYQEIVDDFMKTFVDLHFFDKNAKPLQYSLYKNQIDSFLMILTDTHDLEKIEKADFKKAVKKYLLDGGMSEKEISDLYIKITK